MKNDLLNILGLIVMPFALIIVAVLFIVEEIEIFVLDIFGSLIK